MFSGFATNSCSNLWIFKNHVLTQTYNLWMGCMWECMSEWERGRAGQVIRFVLFYHRERRCRCQCTIAVVKSFMTIFGFSRRWCKSGNVSAEQPLSLDATKQIKRRAFVPSKNEHWSCSQTGRSTRSCAPCVRVINDCCDF